MDNLKTFHKFNEELNLDTYRKIKKLGDNRGDLRGQRLSNTADYLMNQNAPKLKLYFSSDPNDRIIVTPLSVSIVEGDYRIALKSSPWFFDLREPSPPYKVWEAYADKQRVYFDRNGRNIIVNLFNNAGIKIENLIGKIPMI
jgi:hypothetical protein